MPANKILPPTKTTFDLHPIAQLRSTFHSHRDTFQEQACHLLLPITTNTSQNIPGSVWKPQAAVSAAGGPVRAQSCLHVPSGCPHWP